MDRKGPARYKISLLINLRWFFSNFLFKAAIEMKTEIEEKTKASSDSSRGFCS